MKDENFKLSQGYYKYNSGYMSHSIEDENWRNSLRVRNNIKLYNRNKYMRYWKTRNKDMCLYECDN